MLKDTNIKFISRTALRFFVYTLLVGAVALCVTWEAKYGSAEHLFSEDSILEYLQVLALLFTALAAHMAGQWSKPRVALSSLLVGAACIACIREFDFALDRYIFDGAWQLMACITAFIAISRTWQHKADLKAAVCDFMGRPSFGMMSAGFFTVFVFSRLIGRQVFWQAVMGDGYMRVVKNAVEESTELLGYTLILIGSLEFLRDALMAEKSSLPSAMGAALDNITKGYNTLPGHQVTMGFDDKHLHPRG